MPRFTFELAAPADGQELLEVLEEASFKGNISLLYTRRPDAYQSFLHEGPQVDIVVCRDREREKIVGFGACALRQVFINGVPRTVGYLFGLRTRQEYMRKFPLLHKGYAMIPELHKKKDVPFYLTTILEENCYAQRLLEKRRASMPAYMPYGGYTVYALLSKTAQRGEIPPWQFRQAQQSDATRLITFLSEHGRRMQFFPVLQENDLQSARLPNLPLTNFHLLLNKHNEILSVGALWDQTAYKQYIVQRYGGIFKLLLPLSRAFPLFGFPALPAPGSALRFFTLSFWAVKDQNPDIFRHYLRAIIHLGSGYPFFLIGLHQRHPLRKIVEQQPHISYPSRLYLVSWENRPGMSAFVDTEMVPYLECGML
jgi:hypothetical protein